MLTTILSELVEKQRSDRHLYTSTLSDRHFNVGRRRGVVRRSVVGEAAVCIVAVRLSAAARRCAAARLCPAARRFAAAASAPGTAAWRTSCSSGLSTGNGAA